MSTAAAVRLDVLGAGYRASMLYTIFIILAIVALVLFLLGRR